MGGVKGGLGDKDIGIDWGGDRAYGRKCWLTSIAKIYRGKIRVSPTGISTLLRVQPCD